MTTPDTNTGGSDTAIQPVPDGDVTLATPRPKRVRLTHRQRLFVAEYARTWNTRKSAIFAGYSLKTAGSQGCQLLKNPKIAGAVATAMKDLQISPDQVLSRWAAIANCSIADFLDERGNVDIEKVKANGQVVKSLEQKGHGFKLELHDALRALELIGKAHKLFGNDSAQANVAIQAFFERDNLRAYAQNRFGVDIDEI
jgi:phage terminase small subunit